MTTVIFLTLPPGPSRLTEEPGPPQNTIFRHKNSLMKNTAKRSVGFLPYGRRTHGRDRSKPLRKNWESVKEQVMRKALRAKFEQHPELRALLLATAPAKLVEHTENDAYWGDGGNGKGKNRLGYLLMELREQLAIEK